MQGLAINGGRSQIARALVKNWLSPHETVIQVKRGEHMPPDAVRYLFCQGLLTGKAYPDQTEQEIVDGYHVNYTWIANQCDRIFDANARARVCLIGSESGFAGSYDPVYAEAKRQLHLYTENKRLRTPDQQLVCIAPSIIADAGMTIRRKDVADLERRMEAHPKQRFLRADEVAGLIHHVLYIDQGYLSGVTIRMNGGAHALNAQDWQKRTIADVAPGA